MGWDDDASHSQVICPSEDSESTLIYLVVCLNNEMYVFWTIQFLIRKNEQKNISFERVAQDNTR